MSSSQCVFWGFEHFKSHYEKLFIREQKGLFTSFFIQEYVESHLYFDLYLKQFCLRKIVGIFYYTIIFMLCTNNCWFRLKKKLIIKVIIIIINLYLILFISKDSFCHGRNDTVLCFKLSHIYILIIHCSIC